MLNTEYGCPDVLERRNLGVHLEKCSASVVVCRMQWKRRRLPPGLIIGKSAYNLATQNLTEDNREEIRLDIISIVRDENILTDNFQKRLETVRNKLPGQVSVFLPGENSSRLTEFKSKPGDLPILLENRLYSTDEKISNESTSEGIETEEYIFTCGKEFRRDEIEDHLVNVHGQIHNELDGPLFRKCPNSIVGCQFNYPRICPNSLENRIGYNNATDAFCVKNVQAARNTNPKLDSEILDENENRFLGLEDIMITDLLTKALPYVSRFLDPLSLQSLSLTNKVFREICKNLVKSRGMVVLSWERSLENDLVIWRAIEKKWLFSSSISEIRDWKMTDLSLMEKHVKECSYRFVVPNCQICWRDKVLESTGSRSSRPCGHWINCRHCKRRIQNRKLEEHKLLCSFVTIPCINRQYGCREVMCRKDLNKHLGKCCVMSSYKGLSQAVQLQEFINKNNNTKMPV